MALLRWLDIARNNLATASNSYAEVQRQLDKYNKVFDTYSKASPETQLRAASVMKQALNEYNSLKKQQEENTLRIYEAQSWINYYNRNGSQTSVETQNIQPTQKVALDNNAIETQTTATNEIPVIVTPTPGVLNNNSNATLVEADAIDTMNTVNLPTNQIIANAARQNTIQPTTPIWVTNYINSQTPKYPNTTIWPVSNTQSKYNFTWSTYWPWSVATIWSWNNIIATPSSTGRKWQPLLSTIRSFLKKI